MAKDLVISDATARRLGASLLPENKTHTNRMEIRSSSSTNKYIVAQQKTSRQWQCSCMGWIRHRRCKHLTAMVPLLTADRQPIAPRLGSR